MIILGRALTILVGAMPATYLSLIAGLGIYVGVMALVDGEVAALSMVFWARVP